MGTGSIIMNPPINNYYAHATTFRVEAMVRGYHVYIPPGVFGLLLGKSCHVERRMAIPKIHTLLLC